MAQQNKKQRLVRIVTPPMRLKYPKLDKVDYGTTDFPKPNGEYSTKALLDADSPEAAALIAQLQPHFDEAISQAKVKFQQLKVETRKKLGDVKINDLFTALYDQETEEPTGEIEFKFSMAAGGTVKGGPREGEKWSSKPGIVDANGVNIKKVPAIWGGTVARIACDLSPYFIPGTAACGLKLKLVGVQIIELQSGGERSAASMGFGKVDGGFDISSHSQDDDSDTDDGDDGPFAPGGDSSPAIDEEIPF